LGSPVARISDFVRSLPPAWRLLGPEQRVAAVGSLLLIVSTFGPFTFVEAAEVLTELAVLALLKRRTDGSVFHLPFGDGTAVAAAGAWCGLLILVRLFDRSLGQDLLALACAALVFVAGMRERAKRPMDDLPPETVRVPRERSEPPRERPERPRERPQPPRDAPTTRLPRDADVTEPVPLDGDATERIPRDTDRTERISGPRDPGSGSEEPPR
jgi:hypothetical protein